jgi:diaminohydroxyphosphoribosylaminopyrimidine deaminase/5-amino-6-(5-phosphoribosylamino)uracil reductase
MNKAIRDQDDRYMRMALSLAMRGSGKVSPNPMVGCVIAGHEGLRGWGYHSALGEPHAEVVAIDVAGPSANGATLYVNLEPCCHFGRTPPCVPRIISAGIKRVVAGIADPDPRVARGGFELLRSSGVDVVEGVLAEECRKINRGFLSRVERKRPWITLKAAASLDGNMALSSGESKWISNNHSRIRGHILRAGHDAIMVGVGTVVQDDPFLTVREITGKTSLVIVMDPDFRTPPGAHVTGQECLICGFSNAPSERKQILSGRGCRILEVENDGTGILPLAVILELLADEGINYLLVEGGPTLLGYFFFNRLFDSVSIFFKPAFSGAGRSIGSGFSIESLADSIGVRVDSIRNVEGDLWMEGTRVCLQD